MEQEPSILQHTVYLPCPSCGSQLKYSARHHKLSCDHCGYLEEIDHANDQVVEQSLKDAASRVQEFKPEAEGKRVFDCQNCGAKFMVESEKIKVKCGFCGSTNLNMEAYGHQYIQPIGIIPFYVSREESEKRFKDWIKRGWLHPTKLKKLAAMNDLHGIYIPFWTFDAQTESTWRGEAGFFYTETHMVRINGRMQPQTVTKTRWVFRSGHLKHFFDDILVVASGGLEQKDLERILPYRLEEVVNFDPRLMVGWESEIYRIEIDKGYQLADRIMDHKIRNMCSAQLGGDTQRNLQVSSTKWDQTFKHVILPVWISSYQYQNKTFHFTINGQTGKVYGNKPISWIKIAILVLLFAGFILAVYLMRESGVFQ